MTFNTIFTNTTQTFATPGNVGVGTTVARFGLDVTGFAYISHNVGIGTTIARRLLDIQDGSIIVSNNIGIGTTAPRMALDVTGIAYVSQSIGIGTTLTTNTLAVNGTASVGTYANTAAPTNSLIVSGNVGIGTTIMANKLAVTGTASIGTYANSAAPANSLIVSGSVGIGTTIMANTIDVIGSASIGTYANFAAPANGLIVSGSVGIGTTNPTDLFALGPNGAAFPAPSGNAPLYACRAWLTFNGSTTPPTVISSGNISGVARNATGDFTITFTTAMPQADYAITAISLSDNLTNGTNCVTIAATSNTGSPSVKSTTQVRIITCSSDSATMINNGYVAVMIIC